MIAEQEERIIRHINDVKAEVKEVKDHVKSTNGKVAEHVKEINALKIADEEIKNIIERGDNYCRYVQDSKQKNTRRNKYIITTLIAIIGVLGGMFYKVKENNKTPIELIYQKTDSTYVFPRLYLRSQESQGFTEIHKLYIDFEDK